MPSARSSLVLALVSLGCARLTTADVSPEQEIGVLSDQLARKPEASQFLRRASLRGALRDWPGAMADCESAASLGADPSAVSMARARILMASGKPREAAALLAELPADPTHRGAAAALRADARTALGDTSGAIADLSTAIRHASPPAPDLFLRRASLTPDAAMAIAGLSEGIQQLGPLPALVSTTIDRELQSGKTSDALRRIDALLRTQPGHLPWLELRIRILMASDRPTEANATRQQALAIIGAMPARRRHTEAIRIIRQRLTSGTAP
jgi:predicted Zn-dependent protease